MKRFVILAVLWTACAHTPPAEEVTAAVRNYDHRVVSMNAERIAELYTPDGEIRQPNNVIRGRDAIRAFLESFDGKFRVLENTTTIKGIEIHGDVADVTATFRQRTLVIATGDTVTPNGTLRSEWVRGPDKRWRILWMTTE